MPRPGRGITEVTQVIGLSTDNSRIFPDYTLGFLKSKAANSREELNRLSLPFFIGLGREFLEQHGSEMLDSSSGAALCWPEDEEELTELLAAMMLRQWSFQIEKLKSQRPSESLKRGRETDTRSIDSEPRKVRRSPSELTDGDSITLVSDLPAQQLLERFQGVPVVNVPRLSRTNVSVTSHEDSPRRNYRPEVDQANNEPSRAEVGEHRLPLPQIQNPEPLQPRSDNATSQDITRTAEYEQPDASQSSTQPRDFASALSSNVNHRVSATEQSSLNDGLVITNSSSSNRHDLLQSSQAEPEPISTPSLQSGSTRSREFVAPHTQNELDSIRGKWEFLEPFGAHEVSTARSWHSMRYMSTEMKKLVKFCRQVRPQRSISEKAVAEFSEEIARQIDAVLLACQRKLIEDSQRRRQS